MIPCQNCLNMIYILAVQLHLFVSALCFLADAELGPPLPVHMKLFFAAGTRASLKLDVAGVHHFLKKKKKAGRHLLAGLSLHQVFCSTQKTRWAKYRHRRLRRRSAYSSYRRTPWCFDPRLRVQGNFFKRGSSNIKDLCPDRKCILHPHSCTLGVLMRD